MSGWQEYSNAELGEHVASVVADMLRDKTGELDAEVERLRRQLAIAELRIEQLLDELSRTPA